MAKGRLKVTACLIFLLTWLWPKSVLASEIIVSSGQSIQAAIDSASSGDVIRIQPGTYAEDLTINTANLTLEGTDTAAVILTPSGTGIDISSSGVTVRNLTIHDSPAQAAIGIAISNTSQISVSSLYLHDLSIGVNIDSSSQVSVTNGTLENNTFHIFNNSAAAVTAEPNSWPGQTYSQIQAAIFDRADDPAVGQVVVDTTPPTPAWVSPAAGATVSDQVTLEVSASDSVSGVVQVVLQYKRDDGVDTFHVLTTDTSAPYATSWNTLPLAIDAYILRATASDVAGNVISLDRSVGVAALISSQSSFTAAVDKITISWVTDRPTSGYVVYDTVSHPNLGPASSYGYAFASSTVDAAPKTTAHTVALTGLSDNTNYFWRVVSLGSPAAVGNESQNRTFSFAGPGGPPTGGGAGVSVPPTPSLVLVPTPAPARSEVLGEITEAETVEPTPTPAGSTSPTPAGTVKGANAPGNRRWWVLAALVLVVGGIGMARLWQRRDT